MSYEITRSDYCIVGVAETFRGDGESLANPIGIIPMIGGRLARESFEPSLVMTDGLAAFAANALPPGADTELAVVEAYNPYPQMFEVLWNGKRHVMMGASQIDQYGNQNIACIGDWHQPKSQLLGFRGAPGNTINHPTSYWVPKHNPRSFVQAVDVVTGIGYDRARSLGAVARFHEIRRVVSDLGVFDFESPDNRMRLRSLHPGVTVDQVRQATGFELVIDEVEHTREPTATELTLIREVIDPRGMAQREVPNA